MTDTVYHPRTPAPAARRTELVPGAHQAFEDFSHAVFADGALSERTKQRIVVAAAHVTECPYCIKGHARVAHHEGASPREIMAAIWAAAIRGGSAYAQCPLALHVIDGTRPGSPAGPIAKQARDA